MTQGKTGSVAYLGDVHKISVVRRCHFCWYVETRTLTPDNTDQTHQGFNFQGATNDMPTCKVPANAPQTNALCQGVGEVNRKKCEPMGRDETPGGPKESRWTQFRRICILICVQSTHLYVYARRRDEILTQLLFSLNKSFLATNKSKRCERKPPII